MIKAVKHVLKWYTYIKIKIINNVYSKNKLLSQKKKKNWFPCTIETGKNRSFIVILLDINKLVYRRISYDWTMFFYTWSPWRIGLILDVCDRSLECDEYYRPRVNERISWIFFRGPERLAYRQTASPARRNALTDGQRGDAADVYSTVVCFARPAGATKVHPQPPPIHAPPLEGTVPI